MAITLDGLAAALAAASSNKYYYKATVSAEAAGTWQSLWKVTGYPVAGASPPLYTDGTGYIPTSATLGAIPFTNAAVGNNTYLAQFSAISTVVGQLILYDRLWACSGISTAAIATVPIVAPGSLSRNPNNGLDVEPWLEVYAAPGATGATWTLTGTDSTGTTGRTWTYTHPANPETVGQMMPFNPLTALGGCRAVESLTFSAGTGVTGDIGVTLLRRIATLGVFLANSEATPKDAFALGLPEIQDGACLALMVQCTTTTSGTWSGQLSIADMTP